MNDRWKQTMKKKQKRTNETRWEKGMARLNQRLEGDMWNQKRGRIVGRQNQVGAGNGCGEVC